MSQAAARPVPLREPDEALHVGGRCVAVHLGAAGTAASGLGHQDAAGTAILVGAACQGLAALPSGRQDAHRLAAASGAPGATAADADHQAPAPALRNSDAVRRVEALQAERQPTPEAHPAGRPRERTDAVRAPQVAQEPPGVPRVLRRCPT